MIGLVFALWLAAPQVECSLTPKSVPSYGQVEIRFADQWKLENPDDARQANIAAVFTSPSGREWRMPAFLYKDFERQGDQIVPRGKPEWRVRFTPIERGRWKASLRGTISGQTIAADAGGFEVTEAVARGFLRRAKANPLALEFEDGSPAIAIGPNVFPRTMLGRPLPSDRAINVIRFMERTHAAGGNFCRLRMDASFLPIEMTRDAATGYEGPGRYHAQSCWEVDQIVAAAERLGMTILFCISDANTSINTTAPGSEEAKRLEPYWFYLKSHGGPLDSAGQFWADPEVRRLVLQKMRYSVARWGASPAIGMWEFFNEVQVTPQTVDEVASWHRELGDRWREIDPFRRLVTTSLLGGYKGADLWWKFFRASGMDVLQYHTYAFEDLAGGIREWNSDIIKQADRPLLLGEFGSSVRLRLELGSRGSDPRLDPAGLHLHNGIWAAGLTGAAGALPWFIANYIDVLDLYHVFTGFSRFAVDWKINAGPWRPIRASVEGRFEDGKHWGPLDLPVHEKMAQAEADVYTVNRDGTIVEGSAINGFLFGTRAHPTYRRPPAFVVDYPKDGKFIVTVKSVFAMSGSEAPLIIELDGRELARKTFRSGEGYGKSGARNAQYGNWNNVYDEEVAIAVPAGKHRIRVDAPGTDRIAVGYRLDPYADRQAGVYRVYAMGLAGEARLWVQNTDNTAANRLRKRVPTEKPPAVVRVEVGQPGRYGAEWWDTVKGVPIRNATVEAQDGFVTLEFPGTLSDEACKVRRQN